MGLETSRTLRTLWITLPILFLHVAPTQLQARDRGDCRRLRQIIVYHESYKDTATFDPIFI